MSGVPSSTTGFQERNRMQLVMAFDTDDNELVGTQTEDNIPIYGNLPQIKDKIAQEDIENSHPDSAIS